MRRTRDRIGYAYRRTKVLGQQAWTRSERVLGVLDKGAHLATEGLRVLGDRLDPDVRDGASKVLRQYTSTRVKMKMCNIISSELAEPSRTRASNISH